MVWPGLRACSAGSYRWHVRPKLDTGGRMFAIDVHLAMFASVKHSAASVHFEAGHCQRYEPAEQALNPGQTNFMLLGGGDYKNKKRVVGGDWVGSMLLVGNIWI